MDVEQLIFKKLLDFFKKNTVISEEEQTRTVSLATLLPRLSLISRALTGENVEVIGSEREGGWKDDIFFLPKTVSLFEDVQMNINFYLFRVFYLSIQKKAHYNWKYNEDFSTEISQEKAVEVSKTILKFLFEEYPGLQEIYQQFLDHYPATKDANGKAIKDTSWLYGRFMKNTLDYERKKYLENINKNTVALDDHEITTEIEAQAADEIEVMQVDKYQQEQYVMTHNFEKVDTIDEFNGNWRNFDGDDSLQDDLEALQEYNLKHTVRVDDPVHSVYKAEFKGSAQIAESTEIVDDSFHVSYPEWNYAKREYKMDYCKVYPKINLEDASKYYTNTITENKQTLLKLKKMFAMLNNNFEQTRRQASGDNFDIDATTDLFVDILSKRTPSEKIYLHRKKAKKDISLLFLLDLSLSSDGYAKGNRIIDVEKQVSILFGEVLDEYNIDFQIDGFYSKTRNHTTYINLKSFDEKWNKAKNNIGSVQPQGYTRIGPALRHASTILEKRQSQKKWLILLSDGKPNDYDRYEGQYGIKDIKQALRETKGKGIQNFALAIEEQAKYYLPQMFGKNHYSIISTPMEMIISLTKLYKRIASD